MKHRRSTVLSGSIMLIITALCLFTACESVKDRSLSSGDITVDNVEQVCGILEDAGLSNIDTFKTWVKDTADEADKETENTSFYDSDCRMTVMLLAGDNVKYDSVGENYDAEYLMFDIDLIENDDRYSMLKDKEQLFITMFGEIPIPDRGFANALSERWNKHGIRIDNDKCSIISILFKTFEQEKAFVGHTGILIDCRDNESVDGNYLFVEKIAFGDPFRVTIVQDEKELIRMLSERPDYTTDEGEPTPVVYKNENIIAELKDY